MHLLTININKNIINSHDSIFLPYHHSIYQKIMAKIPIAAEWQFSLDLLNNTVYRKYQHASEHNPIKCGPFSIHKKKSPLKQNMDPLYKKSLNYKLPQVCTNRIRHTMVTQSKKDAEQLNKEGNMFSFYNPKQSKNSSCIVAESMNSTMREGLHSCSQKKLYAQRLIKLKQILLCTYKFGDRDRFFSYIYNIVNILCSNIQNQKDKQSILQMFVKDIELLLESIDKNKSFVSVIKKITAFKKQEKYFLFKSPLFKILFQILLAQLQMLQNNIDKAIQNFQFCEYHCRKNNLEQLTISFLWEISLLNISSLKYQEADENLRNLLQMAVVSKKKKAIKYSLEKISLLYYYRGNSIMGQYYFKKSEEGLSNFEVQIYIRQYNKKDEIKRLQNKLFSFQNYQKIIKRKNNPKFEADIWRESKEQYEQTHLQYMEKVKKMIKNHESATEGRKIKKMVAKIDRIGDIKNVEKSVQFEKMRRKKNQNQQQQNAQPTEDRNQRNSMFRNSQASCKQQSKQVASNTSYINNVTRVIKTHLSSNREGTTINRQHRWRKFTTFLVLFQAELKQLLKFQMQKNCKQSPFNRTQF